MLAITCDSVSWDMSYISQLIVLSDIGSFKISFSYSLQNIIFIILQRAGKFTDSAIVCDLILLPWFH
jgi:hypothetical protein